MAIQLEQVFSSGGRTLIDLLTHCVWSINTDALFLYLAGQYKLRPEAAGALALHDVFCSPHSPGCLQERSMLTPRDLRLQQSIEPIRFALEASKDAVAPSSEVPADGLGDESSPQAMIESETVRETAVIAPPPIPSPYIFDHICRAVRSGSRIRDLEQAYDIARTPTENLPGGEPTASQRVFVDNVWTPNLRPHLAAAGFWRIATIG
ncbi:MAG: hypothetical protein AAFU85_14995 [Planctomycetota bacterium]